MDARQAFREVRQAIREGATEKAWGLLGTDSEVRNMVTPFGTWLHAAADFGNLTLAQRLVNLGADVNQRSGIFGGAAINMAASKGHTEMVRYLLSEGAELDVGEPERNPLFSAIYGGHLEIVRLLVEAGIDWRVKYTGENMKGMDALAFARERGQGDIAAYLAAL
jgi:ankyrin repeat protein